jgi:hypothetical protein
MQQPPSAISERLRAIRRRVTVGVLATFVAAWLAVAAFGKTGKSNASATPDSTTATPQGTVDPYSQPYDDGGRQGFDESGGGSSQQPDNGANSPGPVTSQQS